MGKSTIHMIRHGITEGNQKQWYYGASDIPLANEGVDALTELAKEGIYPSSEGAALYTSGMIRAEQTFFLIYGRQEHQTIPELKEFNFGIYEKLSHEDLKDDEAYIAWITDESGATIPEKGESRLLFVERIKDGFEKLLGLHRLTELSVRHSGKDATSIIVCHGGVIAAVMNEAFPDDKSSFFAWTPDPGRGYSIEIEKGKPVAYKEI